MQHSAEHNSRLQWRGDWRTTLFTACLLPIFMGLGAWQLQRAAEKADIKLRFEQRQLEAPRSLASVRGSAETLAYRRVLLEGEFIEGRDFLLDNRMYQGRYGFEVLTPVRLKESQRQVLVNRGWIAGDPARRELPDIPPLVGPAQLVGSIYVPPGDPYTLGDIAADRAWPRQLLALDVAAMANMLDAILYPYSIRLDADSPGALLVDWPVVNVSPEKHQAYAVQWFSMAAALLLLYLWRSSNIGGWWKQRNKEKDQ
jgi:surfeit locus 1 family protein